MLVGLMLLMKCSLVIYGYFYWCYTWKYSRVIRLRICRNLTERNKINVCNRNGLLINWCRKQIEAMHQVFQVQIFSHLINVLNCIFLFFSSLMFKSYFKDLIYSFHKIRLCTALMKWLFIAFTQVHTHNCALVNPS